MAGPAGLEALSPSAARAVQLARAATSFRLARRRGPQVTESPSPTSGTIHGATIDAEVGPEDLLVGVLLAHPDAAGEGRVLLHHFGLTARDVLPADYPAVDFADLARHAAGLPEAVDRSGLVEIEAVLDNARSLGEGTARLAHVLAALLNLGPPLRWSEALAARGAEWTTVLDSYRRWLAAEPSEGRGVAGERLRGWLEGQNPRRPVDVPRFASDQIDAGRDLVGIQSEADAFAYLIASVDLTPPLAIGLFGDWGSGKSFLMQAIDRRLDTLTASVADDAQSQVRVWKSIDRIEFNAWEYVQGNLWAGLLERIFAALGTFRPQLVEARRRPVEREVAVANRTISDVEVRLEQAERNIGPAEQAVTRAGQRVEDARQEAERRADDARAATAQDEARRALRRLWGWLPVLLLGRRGGDFVTALEQARAELARGRVLTGAYWRNPLHVVLIWLGAMLVPAVAWLLSGWGAGPGASMLGGLAMLVPLVTSTLTVATRWGRERLDDLEAAEAAVQEEFQRPVREQEAALAAARRHLEEVGAQYRAVRDERQQAEQERDRLEAALERLTPERILVEFADQRSAEYAGRLGLLAQVRRDLLAVESAVLASNERLRAEPSTAAGETAAGEAAAGEAAAGEAAADGGAPRQVPNRIVLYIDDLDRCPPDTVLEVLEAVHLLLSFRMFVVVVAVDSRWLTSALTDRLIALRSDAHGENGDGQDRATPKDYLEKIFQLPFWVQPVPPAGRGQLLHGLLADSVRYEGDGPDEVGAAGDGLALTDREREAVEAMLVRHGAEVRLDTSPLTLSPSDLAFLEGLAVLLGDTPRRIKRFVNTCQLLYAMAPPLNPHGSPSERHVIALVSAISEGLPGVAARWLPDLTRCGASVPDRSPTDAALGATTLLTHATALPELAGPAEAGVPMGEPMGVPTAERARLLGWLEANPGWKSVTLAQLDVRLDMIRRLRFDRPREPQRRTRRTRAS